MGSSQHNFHTSYDVTSNIEKMRLKYGISCNLEASEFMKPILDRVAKKREEYRLLLRDLDRQYTAPQETSDKKQRRNETNRKSANVCKVVEGIMECELELKMNESSRKVKKNISRIQELRTNRIRILHMKMKETNKHGHVVGLLESESGLMGFVLESSPGIPSHSPSLPHYTFDFLSSDEYCVYMKDVMDLPELKLDVSPPEF